MAQGVAPVSEGYSRWYADVVQMAELVELTAAVEKGFAGGCWCGDAACEERAKEETKATTRCIPFEQPGVTGRCAVCGAEAREVAIFGRAY